MQFDWTISAGNLLTFAGMTLAVVTTVWKFYGAFVTRQTAFEGLIGRHADTLMSHAVRMEKQDDLLREVIGDVRQLVGRMEANQTVGIQQAAAEAVAVIARAAADAQRTLSKAAETAVHVVKEEAKASC